MPFGEAGDNALAPVAKGLGVVTSLARFSTESQENTGPSGCLRSLTVHGIVPPVADETADRFFS